MGLPPSLVPRSLLDLAIPMSPSSRRSSPPPSSAAECCSSQQKAIFSFWKVLGYLGWAWRRVDKRAACTCHFQLCRLHLAMALGLHFAWAILCTNKFTIKCNKICWSAPISLGRASTIFSLKSDLKILKFCPKKSMSIEKHALNQEDYVGGLNTSELPAYRWHLFLRPMTQS